MPADKLKTAKMGNNKSNGVKKTSASNSKRPVNPLPAPKIGRVKDPYR